MGKFTATGKEYYAAYTEATKVLHLGTAEDGMNVGTGQDKLVHNTDVNVVIAQVNAADLGRTITIDDFEDLDTI